MKIFLSAVSAQFEACRNALASDLRAIGCEVKVQEDFRMGPRTLIERLEDYVAQCDRVNMLVGDAYGCEATGTAVPAVDPPRSYTQWEYFFAMGERLDGARAECKDLYPYFASEEYLPAHRVDQPAEHAERQRRFVEHLKATGEHWSPFDSLDQLCRRVLRDGWQRDDRPSRVDAPESAALVALREAFAAGSVPELSDDERAEILRHVPGTLDEYRGARWAEWSHPRHALDKRFTRLTLLVDQGPDTQGARWQAQPRTFHDLRDVLAAVSEPAVVVLGPPGCGKSTLLRRLELDVAAAALTAPAKEAPLSVFRPLNRYRSPRVGEALPAPREWLEGEWTRVAGPRLPALGELLRSRRMVLLLDAVNEMPRRDEADYRERIALWRDYLTDLARQAPGTRVVFSCRSLDYSAPLSTTDLPVPHVRIERLADEQVEEFLTVYDLEHGRALWRQLEGTPQLDLFRSPFYLKLLLAQAAPGATLLEGRAALFTSFVRQAIAREVEANNPLFRPGPLLDRSDHERIVRREFRDRTRSRAAVRCYPPSPAWPSASRSGAEQPRSRRCGRPTTRRSPSSAEKTPKTFCAPESLSRCSSTSGRTSLPPAMRERGHGSLAVAADRLRASLSRRQCGRGSLQGYASRQNFAALSQTIFLRSSAGTSMNISSMTLREYGQSLPW